MIVPSTNDRPPQKGGVPSSPPPDSALLMAAATMHQMGRLGPMRPKAPLEINPQKPGPRGPNETPAGDTPEEGGLGIRGGLDKPEQLAMAKLPPTGPASVSMLSPRATNLLRKQLQNADSDEDLAKIRKKMEKMGLDPGAAGISD